MDPLKQYIYPFVVEVILLPIFTFLASTKGSCLTGAFFFSPGKSVVDNHALYGHTISNLTALKPIDCFRACRVDCRCISFNFKQRENRCQLNDENRHTSSSALGFAEGWQYYDLVMDYNIRSTGPFVDCQNSCCENNPCLNGGTCHETCDVLGKRFRCECGPHATGNLCETAICSTPDWLRLNNSCFKLITVKIPWLQAQTYCAGMNSNLTSIHSVEENNFVRQVVSAGSSYMWIGLSRKIDSHDDSFHWVDGSDLSFTNWGSGEPSSIHENCTEFVMRTGGKWNDLRCTVHKSFICGKKLNP